MGKKKIIQGNDTKIDKSAKITPLFMDNVITANKTNSDGQIINVSPQNAVLARNEVDANHK